MSATSQTPETSGGLTTSLKIITGFVVLMLLTVIAMIVLRFVDAGPRLSGSYKIYGSATVSLLAPYTDSPRIETITGRPLAASEDATVLLVETNPGREVAGIDTRSGVQRYSISDMNCSGAAESTLRTGVVECIGTRGDEHYLASLEIKTGRLLVATQLDPEITKVVGVAAGEQLIIKAITDGAASLVAFEDGSRVWQRALINPAEICTATESAIGCDDESGYEIFNLADGKVSVERTELTAGEGFQLAADGYAITTDSEQRTYLFDVTGENVGSAQTFRMPAYPSRAQGALYSLTDLSQNEPVVAVDKSGAIIVGDDEGHLVYAASGDKAGGSVLAVSDDGSQILVSLDGVTTKLVDSNGVGASEAFGSDAANIKLIDGIITVDDGTEFKLYRAA